MEKAVSVSALNEYLRRVIDMIPDVKNILVEGEISNFKHNASGHLYFTLKDEKSQIPCVMFKSNASNITFSPKDGDKVTVKASLTVYPEGGRYQLICLQINESGKGDLYLKFEELKKKLSEKGYFDESHKKSFPEYPKCIALLTSKTGAVIEDLKTIILKRSQFSNLILFPTKVQGDDAKFDIVRNIERANKDERIDCIILARGGGSIEDLWPFNEEIVADAIYNSVKPIMSAVGHETDFTISDFVSDRRAATPSDAALIIVKDNKDLISELEHLSIRLNNSYKRNLDLFKQSLMNMDLRLDNLSPKKVLENEFNNINNLREMLNKAYLKIIDKDKYEHSVLNEKLILLNPLNIIDKGYSVTFKDNKVVKSINELIINDEIKIKMKDGTITSIVKDKE